MTSRSNAAPRQEGVRGEGKGGRELINEQAGEAGTERGPGKEGLGGDSLQE